MIANLFGPDLGIVVLVLLVVLLFGSQLPKVARNLGSAGREFRKAQAEAEEEAEKEKAAKAARTPALGAPAAPAVSAPNTVGAASVGGDPAAANAEGSITLTPAQLDALLKAREEQARGGQTPPVGS